MRLYKINEILEYTYYQLPQELFENERYQYLSIEAKVIYSFLLNRMNLSKINHWINDNSEIYLIYTRKEIQSKLNLSDKPVTRAFKELREANLIKEEKQGFGKPNLIYIGKIEHADLKINKIKENNYLEVDYIRLDNQTKEDCHIEENTINDNVLFNRIKNRTSDIADEKCKKQNATVKCFYYFLCLWQAKLFKT